MPKTCIGCGAPLQQDDPKAPGYTPDLEKDLCQRCFKLRNYGQLTLNMQQGVPSAETLEKINDLDGTVFWIVDLFNFEGSMISRLNQKLPGKSINLILTKRDLLPATLSDEKLSAFVRNRLKEEGVQVDSAFIAGHLSENSKESKEVIEELSEYIDDTRKGGNAIFMGSANAGKSTLLNRLLNRSSLTVSRHPGTTLDVVPIDTGKGIFYDTPGIEIPLSILSWADDKDLKDIIPAKPVKPFISQIYEDQSFAVGGLARLDVECEKKGTVVGYFSRNLPIHRGKLANADELWKKHYGEMLAPIVPGDVPFQTYRAPKLKHGEKMDIVIYGLGWFTVSGGISDVKVSVPRGIHVSFRKAML